MEKIASTHQFERFIQENDLAVVQFHTQRCPDCRRIERPYADYAGANAQQAAFAEVNADQERGLAEQFDVRGIPSFLVFAGGHLVDRLYSRDAKTARQVVEFLDRALAGEAALKAGA